ncbi:hypothetical protein ACFFRR_006857 [Megaselia abdita]
MQRYRHLLAMDYNSKFVLTFLLLSLLTLRSINGDGLRLPDQPSQQSNVQNINQQQVQQPQAFGEERGRQGKGLLNLFGLGSDGNADPYIARTNGNCLSGDLSECFKSQALTNFDEIFFRDSYQMTDFARVVKVSEGESRSLYQEPFEYSEESRSNDDDWTQLTKYALRRAERFLKSAALEINVPEELTSGGRYSPRFIGDDIDSEIDVIEDKHAPVFTKKKLKKLFIPLLLVLKIFKLKLLLFLPFILGLVGLKKILSIGAIVLPGLFAFFKLCRPNSTFGGGFANGISGFFGGKNVPEYSPQGLGQASYHHHEHEYHSAGGNPFYRQEPTFSKPYSDYYGKNSQQFSQAQSSSNSIRFGESSPQDLAYQGYGEYRSKNSDVAAQ